MNKLYKYFKFEKYKDEYMETYMLHDGVYTYNLSDESDLIVFCERWNKHYAKYIKMQSANYHLKNMLKSAYKIIKELNILKDRLDFIEGINDYKDCSD